MSQCPRCYPLPSSCCPTTLDEVAALAVARFPDLAAGARAFEGGGRLNRLVAEALALIPDGGVVVAEMVDAVRRALKGSPR